MVGADQSIPHISVVVPVFNMERYLPACLDSLLEGGNHCPFEVVAVNDASTDRSDTILSDYERRFGNLIVIRFDKNRGVSSARNAGLDAARGDYVMFCDPDDAFVAGAIDYISNVVKEKNPDLVFFRHKGVNAQSNDVEACFNAEIHSYDMTRKATAIQGFKTLFSNLWTWNGAFHRRLFSCLRFDESLWPSEDVLWGVQSTCRCKSALATNAVLYKYHQHDNSCLHRVFFSRVRSEIQGIGLFYNEATRWPFYKNVWRLVFSNLNFRAFARPIEIISLLPPREREDAWNLLFQVYGPVFSKDVPFPFRPLYRIALNRKSRFLVSHVLSFFPRLKYNALIYGLKTGLVRFIKGVDKPFASESSASWPHPHHCEEQEPPFHMSAFELGKIRWKLFRLACRIFLGKTFGEAMLGTSASLDFEDDQVFEDLRKHVEKRFPISDPETVSYHYSEDSPEYFRPSSSYGTKSAWLLRDVFVSPKHGAIWTPEGKLLQESVTNLATFYLFGGPMETLRRAVRDDGDTPIVPFRSNLVYYHTLLDDLPQLLHAFDFRPDSRILLSRKHPKYIDGMLEFIGVDPTKIVLSDRPLRASLCMFVPKLARTSFIRPCDLTRLRAALLPRIPDSDSGRRIYISRRGTALRPFPNEEEIERELRANGFEILRFEDMPFPEQLAAVRSARVIIAPHGSGLANLVVAREGTRVVEVMPSEWTRSTFPRLCSQLGLDHRLVLCDSSRIPIENVMSAICREVDNP